MPALCCVLLLGIVITEHAMLMHSRHREAELMRLVEQNIATAETANRQTDQAIAAGFKLKAAFDSMSASFDGCLAILKRSRT